MEYSAEYRRAAAQAALAQVNRPKQPRLRTVPWPDRRAYQREYYRQHRDKWRNAERAREYRENNRDALRVAQKCRVTIAEARRMLAEGFIPQERQIRRQVQK